MELWSCQSSSNAQHIRFGNTSVAERDVVVNISDGISSVLVHTQDKELEVLNTERSPRCNIQFEYSIKLINSKKMSEFKNTRICKWNCLNTVKELREFLILKVPTEINFGGEKLDFGIVEIGYIEPGHGMKGKKQWLYTDNDVVAMYNKHKGKASILLWAHSSMPPKAGISTNITRSSASLEEHKKSRSEVDEKYEELRKKHGNKYTLEQLRMWAQMIRLGKHESLDVPPDKPFWQGRKRQRSTTADSASSPKRLVSSPLKKLSARSELLDQLTKWHKLSEAGVVSEEEYKNLKEKILSDINQL